MVTALAVMYFTLLGIMAGTGSGLGRKGGAVGRKFCGMVGASNVVVRTIGALVVRVSALAVRVSALAERVGAQTERVGAQTGAISAFSVLV